MTDFPYDDEREELFDAIAFWHGAVVHAKDEDTREFAKAQIARLRCKMTLLEYEHGKQSWSADMRAMQDDQDAEELF